MDGLHISLKAEPVFNIGTFEITNSMLAALIVGLVCISLVVIYRLSRAGGHYFLHGFVSGMYNFSESIVGPKKAEVFFPLCAIFFIYILFSNWFGLIPGISGIFWHGADHHEVHFLRAPTADLNTTVALAVISVIAAHWYGFRSLGLKKQLKKYFDFSSPLAFYVGILELISEFSKILSFSFRLFGNIFAGEVLLIIIAFLVPLVASTPFLFLELIVGAIQAFVFSMLSLIFISLSVEHH